MKLKAEITGFLINDHSLSDLCISLLSIAVIHTTTKSTMGKKGIISPYSLESLMKRKTGTQSRNPEAGTDAEYLEKYYLLLVLHSLLSLPSYTSQSTCPGMTSSTVCRVLPHQSSIKRMPHRFAHR